jgi:hypothetical protein
VITANSSIPRLFFRVCFFLGVGVEELAESADVAKPLDVKCCISGISGRGRDVMAGGHRGGSDEVLIERVGPQTALVYLHNTHISVNVKAALLVIDPDADDRVLCAHDRLQGLQQI